MGIGNDHEKIEALAQKGKEDFYFFMRYILGTEAGFELIDEVPHREMCQIAQTWNKRYKLILMPRDTFKTTVLVVGQTLWDLVRDPQTANLITSDKITTSAASLAVVKDVIEGHELFKLCYGDLRGDRVWTNKEIKIATRTGNKRAPSVAISGVGSSKVSFHFDRIYFDDPHNENNISTPEQIERVIRYLDGLDPIMDTRTGRLQLTATRWHHRDVHNHIINTQGAMWDITVRAAEWEENGETKFFFPSRLTREFLDTKKQRMRNYFFNCQYLNNPIDDEYALFKEGDLKYFDESEDYVVFSDDGDKYFKIKKKDLNFFISVDPAGSGTLARQYQKDYTGFIVIAVDHDGRWFIFEAERKKGMQPSDIVDKLIAYHRTYHPEVIGIEHITYQGQIRRDLLRAFENRSIYQAVKDLHHHNRSKFQRIKGLEPLYKRGRIYHSRKLYDLEQELLSWSPNSSVHDDLIDPLAYICDIVSPPEKSEVINAPKLDYYHDPHWIITADMEWTRRGKRGSFADFLGHFDDKALYESEMRVKEKRESELAKYQYN